VHLIREMAASADQLRALECTVILCANFTAAEDTRSVRRGIIKRLIRGNAILVSLPSLAAVLLAAETQ
jgi:hypothetical protein